LCGVHPLVSDPGKAPDGQLVRCTTL